MLHIFCPFRNREDRRWDFVQHFRTHYPEAKIVLIEQVDNLLFRKGQLNNIAFNFFESELDNFIFIDIDMRLFYRIEFEKLICNSELMLIPYDEIYRYQLADSTYVNMNLSPWLRTPGGMHLFNKNLFINSCGYSNLYIGYAAEDLEMTKRIPFVKIKNKVIHLEHTSNYKQEVIQRNLKLCDDRSNFNKNLDGFIHTTAKSVSVSKIEENVSWMKISGIGVTDDFKYKDFLRYD